MKLISDYQFGFRKKSNTEVAAIELIDQIQHIIDTKKKASIVLMDIKKTFDMVNTNKLLAVLDAYGIRGNANKLLESYLTNRVQYVKVGSAASKEIHFSHSVIQGSAIGAYLFTLFINQISTLSTKGKIFMFADDCILLNEHEIEEPVSKKIEKDMFKIINFINYRGLILNANKTSYMICHSKYNKVPDENEISIKIDNERKFDINRVYKARYLGLMLYCNLNWESHIQHVESKIANGAGILWKLRKELPQRIKKLVYFSLVQSHLNYMIAIWGTATYNLIRPLQIIQNRTLRNVFNLDRLHNRVDMYTHKVENCLPISALYYVSVATFMYNSLSKRIRTNFVFTPSPCNSLRERNKLRPRKARTNYGINSILTKGPKIFNDVPLAIKRSPHQYAFKWTLTCHLRKEESMKLFLNI